MLSDQSLRTFAEIKFLETQRSDGRTDMRITPEEAERYFNLHT